MEKKKKEFKILKSNYPDESGDYILWIHSHTKHGENWRGIFKGSRKDCLIKKQKLLNGEL